ncbi:MAG: FtsX-like permease family protein, partial [Bacteroidota bacterium]
TAKSFERANEVGVRKVMGAEKGQLVKQFLSESLLINLLATVLAVLIVIISWPSFARLAGREIPLTYVIDGQFWLLVSGLFLVGTILSGFYPALVLSSFRPVAVLKGKIMKSSGGNFMRKGLVVFQFVASVILISGTIIVYQQMNFMKNRDLGVDINQTLVLEGPGITDSLYDQNLEGFKKEALKIAGVKRITAASNIPGDEIYWTNGIRRLQGGPESSLTVYNVGIDQDYVPAFDLKMVAGRNFDQKFSNDNERVLLNRELAEALDFEPVESAVGEKVRVGGDTMEVAGILENYHQMSLKNKVRPLVFRFTTSSSFYSLKVASDNYQDVLTAVQKPWDTFFPGNPVDYFFLDSFFNKQYESDRQFGQLFSLFSLLAIFVASLGLFGLASFLTLQRTKEVGIRKVLGSKVSSIVLLLSKGFIQLVLVANLIAWPLAWWVMDSWLASFPYRIDINPLLFLGAGLGVVIIAFLSVGFQTLKAALLNPAETLKYE